MSQHKLYYHKTDGGAEYFTDRFVVCPNGKKEGVFEDAQFIVRVYGDEAEVSFDDGELAALRRCAEALRAFHDWARGEGGGCSPAFESHIRRAAQALAALDKESKP